MKYAHYFGRVVRAYYAPVWDGKNVKYTKRGLAFDGKSGRAIEVDKCGCYSANGRSYASEEELVYFFDNHRNVHFPHVAWVYNLAPDRCPPADRDPETFFGAALPAESFGKVGNFDLFPRKKLFDRSSGV